MSRNGQPRKRPAPGRTRTGRPETATPDGAEKIPAGESRGELHSYGDGAIRVTAATPSGVRYPRHRHEEHQLAWASSGVLTVSCEDATWVLPPSRALWIPAGIAHVTVAGRHTAFCSPYFGAARGPRWSGPTPVAVSALTRELILHLAGADAGPAARRRAEGVLLDQLSPIPVTTITVPMPRDPRALDVADRVLADPADGATLGSWGRRVGASGRTLARLFPAETGMTFGRWRTQARLRAAMPLLAEAVPVATVARAVGYETPSAFVAVFRRTVGVPPAAYFATPRG